MVRKRGEGRGASGSGREDDGRIGHQVQPPAPDHRCGAGSCHPVRSAQAGVQNLAGFKRRQPSKFQRSSPGKQIDRGQPARDRCGVGPHRHHRLAVPPQRCGEASYRCFQQVDGLSGEPGPRGGGPGDGPRGRIMNHQKIIADQPVPGQGQGRGEGRLAAAGFTAERHAFRPDRDRGGMQRQKTAPIGDPVQPGGRDRLPHRMRGRRLGQPDHDLTCIDGGAAEGVQAQNRAVGRQCSLSEHDISRPRRGGRIGVDLQEIDLALNGQSGGPVPEHPHFLSTEAAQRRIRQ